MCLTRTKCFDKGQRLAPEECQVKAVKQMSFLATSLAPTFRCYIALGHQSCCPAVSPAHMSKQAWQVSFTLLFTIIALAYCPVLFYQWYCYTEVSSMAS